MEKKTQKIVFREDLKTEAKAVFGTVEDLNDGFIRVITESGVVFTINKSAIIFIKEGDY
jgi:acylphosphatase